MKQKNNQKSKSLELDYPHLEGMIKYLVVLGDGADQFCCFLCGAKGDKELSQLKNLGKHISPLLLDPNKDQRTLPRFGNLKVEYLKKKEVFELVDRHKISHLMQVIVDKKLHNSRKNLYIKLGIVEKGTYYERVGDEFKPNYGVKLDKIFKHASKIVNPFEGRKIESLNKFKKEAFEALMDFKRFEQKKM